MRSVLINTRGIPFCDCSKACFPFLFFELNWSCFFLSCAIPSCYILDQRMQVSLIVLTYTVVSSLKATYSSSPKGELSGEEDPRKKNLRILSPGVPVLSFNQNLTGDFSFFPSLTDSKGYGKAQEWLNLTQSSQEEAMSIVSVLHQAGFACPGLVCICHVLALRLPHCRFALDRS